MGDSSQLNVRSALMNESLTGSSSSLGTYILSFPHSMNQVIVSPPSNHQISNQNKNCQSFINTQTGSCAAAHQSSSNQFPVLLQPLTSACDNNKYRRESTLDINASNNKRSIVCGNQNTDYKSQDSTNESLKTAMHRLQCLPLCGHHNFNENNTSDQGLLPACNQDAVYRFPRSVSFCSDYEMSCNSQAGTTHVTDSTNEVNSQDLSRVHGMALGHSMSSDHSMLTSIVITSTAQETYQSLARISTPVTSKSMFSHYMSDHGQLSLQTTSTGSSASSSASTPTTSSSASTHTGSSSSSSASTPTTPPGEESVHECPSPQVSVLGSEVTHVSVNQQSFVQTYKSMTPWTSKLTAPGYTPLPKPASDAMPIPLEHISQEYMLAMSSPSQEMRSQSWHAKPSQIYSHLKPGMSVDCYNETISNKIKNRSMGGSMHSHRPKMTPNKEYKFRRTAEALHKSGLWEVAMKTGSLIKRNRELQKELEEFRSDAIAFLKSVIKNPQNRGFIKNVLKTALTSNNGTRNGSSVLSVVVSAAAAAAASVKMDSASSSDESMSDSSST